MAAADSSLLTGAGGARIQRVSRYLSHPGFEVRLAFGCTKTGRVGARTARAKVLRINRVAGNQTALVRFAPASWLEQHTHTQEEECLVLEGEIKIGSHVLRAGDMHVAQPGTRHAPVHSVRGALLLVRSDIVATGYSMA